MPYVTENNENKYASSGVGTAALVMSIFGAAGVSGLFNGGLGGLFGGNQNPTASPVYQLAQKDSVIAKLESERYADEQNKSVMLELSNVKQRLAAIEVAEPLREQNLQMQIGTLGATIARLTQPMIPNVNVAYPPPVPTFSVPAPAQGGTATSSGSSN